jgi:glycolate oxidase iron-sulfur subunit
MNTVPPSESTTSPHLPATSAASSSAGTTPAADPSHLADWLTNCVHCGFCLEVCPTYQLTGDENNSPRGRLRLWREEAEGQLPPDSWTAEYTSDCVGCLACEPACPANVPYGRILQHVRAEHVQSRRTTLPWSLTAAAAVARRPQLFNWLMSPVRALRRVGLLRHKHLFPGRPPVAMSTAEYAAALQRQLQPQGPRVALLTGCLMEAVFREINFATVRVLVENNLQVIVPTEQGCCGAVHEHLGLPDVEALQRHNRDVYLRSGVEAVLTNSAGCGLATQHALGGDLPVQDVLDFLGQHGVVSRPRRSPAARVYVDLPCHLVHGQRRPGIPASVLDATGYAWEWAPQATDCCGSGGVYHLREPELAQQILAKKSAFLNTAEGDPVILASSNHVCLMQWFSARQTGLVTRPYQVSHIIQLLDPGDFSC